MGSAGGDEPAEHQHDTRPTSARTVGSHTALDQVRIEDDGHRRWLLRTDNRLVGVGKDVVVSVAVVTIVGVLLFAISGSWPPLVAVESPSMHPNVQTGDMVFVATPDRFVGADSIGATGVVPLHSTAEYERFGDGGDVIVFAPDGEADETPVIHRAHHWVDAGENWVEHADSQAVREKSCADIRTCPARHDGFITKGDNNDAYDQLERSGADTDVVKPDWVTAKAIYRVPRVGYIRIAFETVLP